MNKMKQKFKKFRSYSLGDKTFVITNYVLLALIAFICAYPMYFCLIASVSDPYASYRGEVIWKPIGFTMDAYRYIIENDVIWRGYANSLIYTLATVVMHLICVVPFGFGLSRKHLVGRKAVMVFCMISMYFGGGMIPCYIVYNQLGLVGNPLLIILLGSFSVWNVLLCRTYFKNNIPDTLYEAAYMDGAGEFRSFFEIAIPLAKPIIAVIALYAAVGQWSNYWNSLIYLRDEAMHPLQLVLRRILIVNQNEFENAIISGSLELITEMERKNYIAMTMKYATVFISSLPMLILYPFIQKYFVKGVMIGSVKE